MYDRREDFLRVSLPDRICHWVRTLRVSCTVAGLAMVALAMPAISAADFEQVVPSGGQAQPSESRVVPVMDHFGGITVWSQQPPPSPNESPYYLHARRGGQEMRLPIAPRALPFDVDLGPDDEGGVVAVYSRCERQPSYHESELDAARNTGYAAMPYPVWTASEGCDLFRFDFSTMQESKVAGASTDQASEMLPSIWKDKIAFARVYEQREGTRGVNPYLYVRALEGGASERQPGGSRGVSGLPGPTRLDLYGRRLAFVWNHVNPEDPTHERPQFVSRVRLDTVGGGHRVLSEATAASRSQPGVASFVGPQGDRGKIFYGFQRAVLGGEGGDDRPRTSLLLRYRIATADKAIADSPHFLIDTATEGDETYVGLSLHNFEARATDPGRILRSTSVAYK